MTLLRSTLTTSSLPSSPPPSRILFFGTDDFSLPSLERLHALISDPTSSISSVDVVTTSDVRRTPKAKPTPVPVKKFALEHKLTVHEIPSGLSPLQLEDNWSCPSDFDLGVVVSFGYFVPKPVLSSLRLGAINVHPSLLPAYRGAAPITWAMLRDDDVTGVSIIEVDPEAFDSGGILLQVEEPVHPDEMYTDLRQRLSTMGADCLQAAIRNMELGMRPNLLQRDGQDTPAWKLTQRHGRVRFTVPFDTQKKQLRCGNLNLNDAPSSRELYNRWRALSESVGIWVDWLQHDDDGEHKNTVELRLVEVGPPETFDTTSSVPTHDDASLLIGTIVWCKKTKRAMLKCAPSRENDWTADRNKQWVELKKLQLPGKKILDSLDFANGQRLKKNPILRLY